MSNINNLCSVLFLLFLPNHLVVLDIQLFSLLISYPVCKIIDIFANHYFRVLDLPIFPSSFTVSLKVVYIIIYLVLSSLLVYSFLGLGFSTHCVL
jgi:hypothetical protein